MGDSTSFEAKFGRKFRSDEVLDRIERLESWLSEILRFSPPTSREARTKAKGHIQSVNAILLQNVRTHCAHLIRCVVVKAFCLDSLQLVGRFVGCQP